MPKAQRTRGLSFVYQTSNKFKHNLYQISSLESQPSANLNLPYNNRSVVPSILTKPSIRISINIQLHNLYKTSAAKYWPNFSWKILHELQLQNIDQTLCSKSEQKFSFMTKPQLLNLQQTVANTFLIINISKSNNLNNFWVGIFSLQCHTNQVY